MFIKTIFKGKIDTNEVWSTGISWGIFGLAADVPDPGEAAGLMQALRTATAVNTPPTALRSLMSQELTLTSVRVERRAEDETILDVSEGLFSSATVGTGTATKTPQDAYVFSLRTSTPGARGRGRLYWPALGATLSSSFQISAPSQAAISTDAKTWLSAIGSTMNAYWASVSSVRTAVLSVRSVTDHVCRDVNALQFGSIIDTQRRRRDTLPETYTTVAYP